jgi:hypothetical protein
MTTNGHKKIGGRLEVGKMKIDERRYIPAAEVLEATGEEMREDISRRLRFSKPPEKISVARCYSHIAYSSLVGLYEIIPFAHSPILPLSHWHILPFSHSHILTFSHSHIIPFAHSPIIPLSHYHILTFSHLQMCTRPSISSSRPITTHPRNRESPKHNGGTLVISVLSRSSNLSHT